MAKEKKNIIARLQDYLETKSGQTLLNYLYSWGAAVVILGALFKLTHIKGADLMLFLGMGTEVLVFIISGFDRQASTMGGGASEESKGASGPVIIGGGAPVSGNFAGVSGAPVSAPVEGAEIPAGGGYSGPIVIGGGAPAGPGVDPATLAALANAANAAAGMAASMGQQAGGVAPVAEGEGETAPVAGAPVVGAPVMGGPVITGSGSINIVGEGGTVDIPEVEKVTNEYVDRLRELSETFAKIAESSEKLQMSAEEMDRLSRNLTSINTIYELHLKSLGSQIGNIDHVNDETQHMAEQIEELNNVYKRMLESMTVNMGTGNKTL